MNENVFELNQKVIFIAKDTSIIANKNIEKENFSLII